MSVTLELATTEELLQELFGRNTFAGVIVYSPLAHRFDGQCHKKFLVRSACHDEGTLYLLEAGAQKMRQQIKDEK